MRLAALALAFCLPVSANAAEFLWCLMGDIDSSVLVDISANTLRFNENEPIEAEVHVSPIGISAEWYNKGYELGITYSRSDQSGIFKFRVPNEAPIFGGATCTTTLD